MKRFLTLLIIAVLLCGCTAPAVQETHPTEPMPPLETLPPETAPAETEEPVTEVTEAADPLPYTLRLHAAVPIFEEPSYDAFSVRIVGEDGVYTIVEEKTDNEGVLWGRLKSGAGWVDLEAAKIYTPVTAAYADDALLESEQYIEAITCDEEYATALAFRVREYVRDVELTLLEPDMEDFDGYKVSETLYTVHELLPGLPLVAEVVFYGDMTAYGITFTTEDGAIHHYAVTVSGRNGALVMTEYTP